MPERRKTTGNRDCPDACGIVATVEDGRVTRLDGDRQHPVTRGFLCYSSTTLTIFKPPSPVAIIR
jgi:anaerobic selenocysteine-containing dehydrogenase